MAKTSIPEEIMEKAKEIIAEYNKKTFSKKSGVVYIPEFKGKFLHLKRNEYGTIGSVARLEYTGNMKKWKFAIFKWSSEKYDPEEDFFPGAGLVDGTIEGAMNAGLKAYPV